jgi:hydroxyacylglutathione hydrolase
MVYIMLEIEQILVLNDNYIYLIHDSESLQTAVVDPAVAEPVLNKLTERGWQLNYIFNTHHHSDHVDGNLELKAHTGCTVVGSQADQARIPGLDKAVHEGDVLQLGQHQITVLEAHGHTNGHIVYYFAQAGSLFCGDTLFVMGCGRLFEGTAQQLWQALQKLKALPPTTKVYCAHEYSLNNGRFALTVEPDNQELVHRMNRIKQLREVDLPTVPSTIGEELATNPFFREQSLKLRTQLNMMDKTPLEVFTRLRKMKDSF